MPFFVFFPSIWSLWSYRSSLLLQSWHWWTTIKYFISWMRFIPFTMCFIMTLSLESHTGMTGILLGICFWVWWVGVCRIHLLVFNFRAGLYCRFSSTQSSKLNLFQSGLLATLSKRMITRHEILVARKEKRHSAILHEELNRNNQNAWPTIATGLWGPRSISRHNNQTARVKEVNYKHTSRQTVETFTTIFVAKILFNHHDN